MLLSSSPYFLFRMIIIPDINKTFIYIGIYHIDPGTTGKVVGFLKLKNNHGTISSKLNWYFVISKITTNNNMNISHFFQMLIIPFMDFKIELLY